MWKELSCHADNHASNHAMSFWIREVNGVKFSSAGELGRIGIWYEAVQDEIILRTVCFKKFFLFQMHKTTEILR